MPDLQPLFFVCSANVEPIISGVKQRQKLMTRQCLDIMPRLTGVVAAEPE